MPRTNHLGDIYIVDWPCGDDLGGVGINREKDETDEALAERVGEELKKELLLALKKIRQEQEKEAADEKNRKTFDYEEFKRQEEEFLAQFATDKSTGQTGNDEDVQTIHSAQPETPPEDQVDVLAIEMPPYKMPEVSYEDLVKIQDPKYPHTQVFPPAPWQ